MQFSKSNIIGAFATLAAVVAVGVFYLFDGFELFTSNEKLEKIKKQTADFADYAKLYDTKKIPFAIDLNNMHVVTDNLKKIDPKYIKKYIENNSKNDVPTDPDEYNYFAAGKFSTGGCTAILTLRTPKSGKFDNKYLMRIFERYGTLRSRMLVAEFIGDTKFLNITEMQLRPNLKMTLNDKGVIMAENCDSIASIFSSGVREYQICPAGAVERIK